jgi:thioredoxin 1
MTNFSNEYLTEEPLLDDVCKTEGLILLEFGAPWCPVCQKAQPVIEEVLNKQAQIKHLKIFDGKGKPLGRAFQIKLWPTLILLKNGEEIAREVRPMNTDAVSRIFADQFSNN